MLQLHVTFVSQLWSVGKFKKEIFFLAQFLLSTTTSPTADLWSCYCQTGQVFYNRLWLGQSVLHSCLRFCLDTSPPSSLPSLKSMEFQDLGSRLVDACVVCLPAVLSVFLGEASGSLVCSIRGGRSVSVSQSDAEIQSKEVNNKGLKTRWGQLPPVKLLCLWSAGVWVTPQCAYIYLRLLLLPRIVKVVRGFSNCTFFPVWGRNSQTRAQLSLRKGFGSELRCSHSH